MSLSSSGAAVSASKPSTSWSPSPPSRAGAELCRRYLRRAALRASQGCCPAQESDFDFLFPPAMKGFRRQMLPVSTGGDVCRVLKRTSDDRMRPPVRGPHQRVVVNILLPQFSDFISVMQQFTIECRLCSISAGFLCNGEGHAYLSLRSLVPPAISPPSTIDL